MFDKIIRKTGIHYNSYELKRIAIRTGLGIAVVLILFCCIELKKEAIAANCYEKTLYNATTQGRWLKYGQYEPDTLYQRTIDKIPVLHYARMLTIQLNTGNTDGGVDNVYENEQGNLYNQMKGKNPNGTGDKEKTRGKEEAQGSLLVRYSYGSIQPLQDRQTGAKPGQMVINNDAQTETPLRTILSTVKEQYQWGNTAENSKFLKNYYIADASVGEVASIIDGGKLLSMQTALKRISAEPQILVYHTHGTEGYIDSRNGVEADTVVGMGDILCEELTKKGFSVLHDRTTYDFFNGKDNRNYAYTTARPEIEALLKEYPSIEVILDIHRDSGVARKTVIDGKDTAQIMLFNGLCRNADGPITYLPNPYLDDTLAFSLQLNLLGRERYPGLMYKIYLKNYRYNMHFTGHCMLVELGTLNNTVAEAQNGVKLLAELLCELLTDTN